MNEDQKEPATILTGLLDRKNGKVCEACNAVHAKMTDPCTREALANKIFRLVTANQAIPGLLETNRELSDICKNFQALLKKADEAHMILMDILSKHGNVGKMIEGEYIERLNAWAPTGNVHTSQDTLENPNPSSQENSTSSAKEISDSTKPPTG